MIRLVVERSFLSYQSGVHFRHTIEFSNVCNWCIITNFYSISHFTDKFGTCYKSDTSKWYKSELNPNKICQNRNLSLDPHVYCLCDRDSADKIGIEM